MNYFEQYKSEIIRTCNAHGTKDAFQCMHTNGEIKSQTYNELYQQILDFKNVMDRENLLPGDRIIILDSYGPSVLRTFISATYWNLTVALIDPNLPKQELDYFIDFLDAKAIFTNEKNVRQINKTAKTKDPDLEVAAIILSSGTTSSMKAVQITYRSLLLCAEVIENMSKIPMEKSYLLVFPLFHISGLASAISTFFYGFTMQMVEEFSPAILQKALQTFNPYLFGMVPKVFELMVQKMNQEIEAKPSIVKTYYKIAIGISEFFMKYCHSRWPGRLLLKPFSKVLFGNNLRYLCVGAAPCNPDVAETIMKMGIVWVYVYASTECGLPITGVGINDYLESTHVGNVFSNEHAQIMIHNPDLTGVGEIYVKTDFIMKNYFREDELISQSFENGYFKTGDLGHIDKKGNLYIDGRQKETIILQTGKKVSPYDLEEVLNAKMNINCEMAVCGVLKPEDGYDLIHVFVKDMNYTNEKQNEIRNQIFEIGKNEAAMYPIHQIHFVSDIPKSAAGKVRRFLLAEMVQPKKTPSIAKPKEQKNIQSTGNITDDILVIIQKFAKDNETCSLDDKWQEKITMDSLKVLELCTEIEFQTGVAIGADILKQETISDLIEYIKNAKNSRSPHEKN